MDLPSSGGKGLQASCPKEGRGLKGADGIRRAVRFGGKRRDRAFKGKQKKSPPHAGTRANAFGGEAQRQTWKRSVGQCRKGPAEAPPGPSGKKSGERKEG